jgi:hypothetical protein
MSTASTIILKNNENVTFVTNPSITYFKSVYRKYTKFTIAYKEEQPTGNSTFKDNDSVNIDLNYNSDLLCDISLKVFINGNTKNASLDTTNDIWPNDIPLFLIDNIILNLTGPNFDLDVLDKDYINFHAMLNNPKSNNSTYNLDSGKLTCNDGNNFQNMALCGGVINNKNYKGPISNMTAVIPLPFAFSKSIGNAIPLCALNLTNTKLQIIINCSDKTVDGNKFTDSDLNSNIIDLFNYSIISKYIFLSDEEKLRFRNSKQEYLYERVNILNNGSAFTNQSISSGILRINTLSTNHPIKQIYLYNQQNNADIPFNKLQYNLFINNEQVYSDYFNHEFFSKVEILNKFKGSIYKSTSPANASNTIVDNNIALIDFSLKISDGPSGCISPNNNTINLHIKTLNNNNKYNIKIFVVCYYILSIFNQTASFMFE